MHMVAENVSPSTSTISRQSCRIAMRSGYDGVMGWPATDRHGLAAAPAGLGFVQDLLNTHPTHPAPSAKPEPAADLLADLDSARRWLDGAVENWSQETGVPQ